MRNKRMRQLYWEVKKNTKSDNEDFNDIKWTGTLEKTNWNNPIVLSLAKLILNL